MATIPIYARDDFEKLTELRQQVEIAERKAAAMRLDAAREQFTPRRIGDDESNEDAVEAEAAAMVKAKQDAFDAFVDEAAERAEMWSVEPIGHEEFRELLKEHPPRTTKDDDGKEVTVPEDQGFEVNTSTFPKALLTFVDPEDETIRTVVEPKFDSEAAFRRRLKRLSAGHFDSIWAAAFMENRGGIVDPKGLRYSPATPRSDET